MEKYFSFGDLNYVPSSTAIQQLQELEQKIENTKQLTKSYNAKFQELARFNKLLTDGYLKNVNVIVDIGSLLNVYNSVFSKLMSVIKEFDSELAKDIDPAQVAHIQELTEKSIGRVAEFFQKDVESVKTVMSMMGKTDMIGNLNAAAQNFAMTQSAVPRVLASMRAPVGGRKSIVMKSLQGKPTRPKTDGKHKQESRQQKTTIKR